MLSRSPRVTYEVVDGQAVLVDPDGRELLTLNAVGTLVWEALDGTHREAGIVGVLEEHFPDIDRARLETDLRAFLDELQDLGLVGEET
jgi:hypothetical protein